MAIAPTRQQSRSRRALLAGALGGLGAWAAAAAARVDPASAAEGDPVRIGRLNKGRGTTTTLRSKTIRHALGVENAHDVFGIGVLASVGPGVAVQGQAGDGWGVVGDGRVGVRGDGVWGVIGQSPRRSGVQGLTDSGFAIHGRTRDREGFAGYFEGKVFASRFIEIGKIGRPQAPKADRARLYVRDDGTGKLQLVVRFPTGPVQVIATEP